MDFGVLPSIHLGNLHANSPPKGGGIEMSRAERYRPRRQIRRSFAANRLAQTHLEAAYAQIVPVHVRVVSRHRRDFVASHEDNIALAGREGRVA
jgi:hypothetical protein